MAELVTPIVIVDANGIERISGTATLANGGSQTAWAQFFGGSPTVIAPNATTNLPWVVTDHEDPGGLLDLTDPALPLVVATGVYAFAARIQPDDPITPGYAYHGFLGLDTEPLVAQTEMQQSAVGVTNFGTFRVHLAVTRYLLAGASVRIRVQNLNDVDLGFEQDVIVQRIS